MANIKLGMKAKDRITGFEGIVTGICEYLSGCNQALLIPPVNEKGAYQEGHWFDLQRLEIINAKPIELDNSETPGFDQAAPIR